MVFVTIGLVIGMANAGYQTVEHFRIYPEVSGQNSINKLEKKIDDLEKKLDKMDKKLDKIDKMLKNMDKKLDKIEKKGK